MSDELGSRPQGAHNFKERRVSHSSNSAMKWAAGAAAAAVLLGGGYYAWKNSSPSPAASELADNTATFAAPAEFNEAKGNDALIGDTATATSSDSQITATAAPAPAAAKSPAQKAKPRVAAAEVPTETVGVSQAGASANQTDEVVVTAARRPVWSRTPRPERLSEFYPASALDRGREGEASLHCTVAERGMLSCVSVSETPARQGFGRAALQVARTFRHAPQRADGHEAVGTPVNLRVLFRMADGERRRG